jgi:D-serine deaminase-like pyridoxal phosphate-dependent protein
MENLKNLLKKIGELKNIRLEGMMGYEAQIAGVADKVPGQGGLNFVKSLLKRISLKKIAARRKQVVDLINGMGFELKFVNGGGTGSVESTISEQVITEVTVGSGFYNPHLFDYYRNFSMYPAAGFALAINRIPKKGVYTCSGGGYIASGAIEKVKAPAPWLPTGAGLDDNEGAGEVQTPVLYKGPERLHIGDPVFFRHSKAGELCERFNTLLLIKEGKIINEVPTYRGEGKCFL